ncbi:MAG TPA: hypothetical protein VMY42_00525 [Thermoguttaceae bacterium]|nr:hypothetical protein [Thermoguttaceae bacterium]
MIRTMLAWSVVTLVAVTAGCRMCASPYDYSGPTYTGEFGPCDPNYREGSRFSQAESMIYDGLIDPESVGPEVIEPGIIEGEALEPIPDDMAGPLLLLEEESVMAEPIRKHRYSALPQHQMLWR